MLGASSKANVAGPENGSRVGKNPLSVPLACLGQQVGGCGQEAPSEQRRASPSPPPLPSLLLHQCRKCSTDLHIFPNIRDLFFFFLWEETGKNPRKREAGESGARKNTGRLFTKLLQTPSRDRCADTVSQNQGLLLDTLRGSRARMG